MTVTMSHRVPTPHLSNVVAAAVRYFSINSEGDDEA